MRIGQLTTNSQFQCVTSSGHKAVTKSFVVFCLSNICEHFGPRFDSGAADAFIGFTVSRRNGNAVKRNRIKRRLRHVVRDVMPQFEFLNGAAVVVIARPNARTEKYEDLSAEMQKVLNYLRKTVAA